MFHNKKNVEQQSSSSQNRGRNIQMKVTSILEMNTMMEQIWVVTKALGHKTSSSLLDQDHMNNDQVHKSRGEENKVNNQ
jgi:hypothetical protein